MAVNMSDYITPDRCMSEMFMLREANPNAVFLYVEGRDDIKLISRLVKPEVYVGFCKGKAKVCELMEKVEQSRLKNVVAIVDKDYDELLNSESYIDGLYYTDGTDMESTILKVEKTVEKILLEYADSAKVDDYNSNHIPMLVARVYEICSQVGKLRLTNQKYDMGLKFKEVAITDYIDRDLNFDFAMFSDAIITNSEKEDNADSIKGRINYEQEQRYDFWEICRGHDLVKVFQYVFSGGINCLCYGRESFSEKELGRFLRGAYEEKWFTTTNMYRSLNTWQKRKNVELLNVI